MTDPSPAPGRAASRRAAIALIVLASIATVAAYLSAIRYEAHHGRIAGKRWIADDWDRNYYWKVAQFLPTKKVPYAQIPSGYPTLATFSFTVPLLASPGFRMERHVYRLAWSCFMAAVLVATVWFIATFRTSLGLSAAPALLLLAPSPLYFSLMRYDILCALLVCLSIAAFSRERYATAHLILAAATFVKWYPALLFPVYVAYQLSHEPVRPRMRDLWRTRAARHAAVFLAAIVVLTLGSAAAFGWEGLLWPYRYHANRGGQYFNPYWLLERSRGALGFDQLGWTIVKGVFIALEFSIVAIVLFKRIRSLGDVFRYAILAIVLFITFSRIDSPQWILWYLPLVLMFVRDTRTVIAIAVLGVWNYVVFPIGYDFFKPSSTTFSMLVLVKDLILIAVLVFMWRDRGPDAWSLRAVRVAA